MRKTIILVILAAVLLTGVAAVGQPSGLIGQYDLAAPWGVIDEQDILPLSLAFGRPLGKEVPWSWDLNHDRVIDILDIGMIGARQGCVITEACYWR